MADSIIKPNQAKLFKLMLLFSWRGDSFIYISSDSSFTWRRIQAHAKRICIWTSGKA